MPRHTRATSATARGFTLVELMVVIIIIGLLAAIVTPRFINNLERGRQETARAQIANFKTALQSFYLDQHFYPTTEMGLDALITAPADSRIKNYPEGGYLDRSDIPLDPWGNPYVYTSPGTNNSDYDLECYGRDGLDGGDGWDADIESWRL